MSKEQKYTKGFVTSKDGTTIGYRQMGSGPGLILMHGGMGASQNFMKLAVSLSNEFTVYIPDRLIILHGGISSSQYFMKLGTMLSDKFTVYIRDDRGRGLSGPFGDNYGLQREVEDLDALLKKTNAHYIFGASSGGLISLQASLTLASIQKMVLYEPLIYVYKNEMDKFNEIVQRFDKELAGGEVIKAMLISLNVFSKVDPDQKTPLVYHLPSIIWKPLFHHVLAVDEKKC